MGGLTWIFFYQMVHDLFGQILNFGAPYLRGIFALNRTALLNHHVIATELGKTLLVGGFSPPIWKIVKMGSSSPILRAENKTYLSCHHRSCLHLADFFSPKSNQTPSRSSLSKLFLRFQEFSSVGFFQRISAVGKVGVQEWGDLQVSKESNLQDLLRDDEWRIND